MSKRNRGKKHPTMGTVSARIDARREVSDPAWLRHIRSQAARNRRNRRPR